MTAQIADEICSNAPLHETPLAAAALDRSSYRPLTMGCNGRSGSACNAVK
jgi:hypothetical protein